MLYQLSYTPPADQQVATAATWTSAYESYSMICGDDAGADGAAALADGEAQLLLHGDRHDQLTSIAMLSPGITISVPSGSVTTPVTSVVRK